MLIARHDAALRRAARAFVTTAASVDEVVQDTWLAVHAGLQAFEGRSSIKTWIFQILINRARSRGAREARSAGVANASETGHADTPKRLLLRKELSGALVAALRELPERQRTVVVLRDALGWSGGEVCDALAVNRVNQRVLLHRARSRLRDALGHFHQDRAAPRRRPIARYHASATP